MEITPLLYRIVVELEPISKFAEGSTLLEKPMSLIDREEQSRCRGRLVAKGPYAFERHPNGQPEIGDLILFCQFAGDFVKDAATGKDYRIIDDLEVKAVIPQTADKAGVVGL
jgi:co-chaperonin GroES (HSP10)